MPTSSENWYRRPYQGRNFSIAVASMESPLSGYVLFESRSRGFRPAIQWYEGRAHGGILLTSANKKSFRPAFALLHLLTLSKSANTRELGIPVTLLPVLGYHDKNSMVHCHRFVREVPLKHRGHLQVEVL